jgi:predicted Zn-dependent protease
MMNFLFHPNRYYRRWFYGFISILVAVGLVVGTPRPSQAFPRLFDLLLRGIQVIQLSTLSDNQEVSLGGQINKQLMSQEFKPYRNSGVNQYVNRVGQRLVPYSDRPNIPYVFQVIDDNQVNAFSTMGGYVYITTGILKTANNEAELASVIGHEMGHIAARHAIQQMREGALASGLMTAAGLDQNAAVNIGVELALRRPHSRQDEFEADQKGLANIRRAGYAPGAMVSFMEKLLKQPSIPTFLSTHPATRDRITALERAIDPSTANVGDGLDAAAYRSRLGNLG